MLRPSPFRGSSADFPSMLIFPAWTLHAEIGCVMILYATMGNLTGYLLLNVLGVCSCYYLR